MRGFLTFFCFLVPKAWCPDETLISYPLAAWLGTHPFTASVFSLVEQGHYNRDFVRLVVLIRMKNKF